MKYLLASAAVAAISAGAAYADGYFKDKTITYIISTSPGGGYDSYGRLIGQYLGEKLGADKVIFHNLPGAGHIVGTNTLYASPPDGLTIGTFNTGLVYAQLLGQEGVQFDLEKFSWIGKASSDARAIVLTNGSGVTDMQLLRDSGTPVKFAASGIGSANYTETALLTKGLELPIDMIPGYNGNEGEMAMLRGEVVGQVASYESLKPFVDAGNGFYALYIGGDLSPQARDIAETEDGKEIVSLIEANSVLGRLTAAPPGVPEDVLAELRAGYMAVFDDPEFQERAKQMGLSLDPLPGDQVGTMISAALHQNPTTLKILADAMGTEVPLTTVTASIDTLEDGNKLVGFSADGKPVTGTISGSRTKLTIGGAEAKRDDLAVGMACDFEFDPNVSQPEFTSVTCKN